MKSRQFVTLGIVFSCLIVLLVACRGAPSPEPAPALTTQSIISTSPAAGATDVPVNTNVSIQFTEAGKKPSFQLGADIFVGTYNPNNNPSDIEPLTLETLCDGKKGAQWRVTNPNDAAISFTWDADKSSDEGLGVVLANSEAVFTTGQSKTLNLYVGDELQQSVTSEQVECEDRLYGYTFKDSDKTAVLSPKAPLADDQTYTVVLSNRVRTAANNRMFDEPFYFSFSTGGGSGNEPGDATGDFTASVSQDFSDLTFTSNGDTPFTLSAANPVWDAASKTFKADVTLTNTSDASVTGARAILTGFNPDSVASVNPDGYTSGYDPFIEFDTLSAGDSSTQTLTFHSPDGSAFTFGVSLTETNNNFTLNSVSPNAINNDTDTTLTVSGQGIRAETAFFVQSNQLEVSSWSETSATLLLPAGFPPATYGLMAVNPDGTRATLYPGFSTEPGRDPTPIDPQDHKLSFVSGMVVDYTTNRGIDNATVSVPGLSTLTTDDGFYLLQGLPQGKHAIKIEAEGYESVYRFAEVIGDSQTITLKAATLQPKHTAITNIGPAGGTHYANNGSFLVVPEGALAFNTPIQFTHTESALTIPELPQDGYYLAFAKLGPSGLTFKKPATLFLPLQDGIVIPENTPIRISYFDEKDKRWVQDVTSGIITEIDSELFLEYEINHFTWIGGQWFPGGQFTGCIQNSDGSPAAGVSTNQGVTGSTGNFTSSLRRSQSSYDVRVNVYSPLGNQKKSYSYSGTGDLNAGSCLVLPPPPAPEDAVSEPQIDEDFSANCNNNGGGYYSTLPEMSSQTTSALSTTSLSSGQSPLYAADDILSIRGRVRNISTVNFDASSLQLKLGNINETGKLIVRYNSFSDSLDYQLYPENTPAGSINADIGINTLNGQMVDKGTQLNVFEGVEVSKTLVVPVPDYVLPQEVVTPYVHELNGSSDNGVVIMVRERDLEFSGGTFSITVSVPARLTDGDGKTLNIESDNRISLYGEGAFESSSSEVSGGKVQIPVRFSTGLYDELPINMEGIGINRPAVLLPALITQSNNFTSNSSVDEPQFCYRFSEFPSTEGANVQYGVLLPIGFAQGFPPIDPRAGVPIAEEIGDFLNDVFGGIFSASQEEIEETYADPPIEDYPEDPTVAPGPDWVWNGRPGSVPGDLDGAWWNPETKESLRDGDMDPNNPHGPHWDWKVKGVGKGARWYPDGTIEIKE